MNKGTRLSYFKISFATLRQIAQMGRFEYVAGFLVLARHASGQATANFPPYKLSGAGLKSIHEKAFLSEETARGVIETLKEGGFIREASAEAKKESRLARWEIVQGELDLDLPHAFVDPMPGGKVNTPLKRLKETKADATYVDKLTGVPSTELRLDALMLLIGIYKESNMEVFGGLNPLCAFRDWEVKSRTAKDGRFRWGAEPEESSTARAYTRFMEECLAHSFKAPPPTNSRQKSKPALVAPDNLKERFWSAWSAIRGSGLIYEAVCLFDVNPRENKQARLSFSLRINDFHAGSITKSRDPSLLGSFEASTGTELAFYTAEANDRGEPESMWFMLPNKHGHVTGIWRPRFRAHNKDVGAWHDGEVERISEVLGAFSIQD